MQVLLKIKPKTYAMGDVVTVDLIAMHPMETGLRKDKDQKLIPTHYINDIKLYFDNELITTIIGWETISANPYYSVKFKASKEGELKAIIKDNKGESVETKSTIKPRG